MNREIHIQQCEEQLKKCADRYSGGMLTEDELRKDMQTIVWKGFFGYLEEKDLHLSVSAENWERFCMDYRCWSQAGAMPEETSAGKSAEIASGIVCEVSSRDDKPWLRRGHAGGERQMGFAAEGRQKGFAEEASDTEKADCFRLMRFFMISPLYFEAVPDGIPVPDMRAGHFPGEWLIGGKGSWTPDGSLACDENPVGKMVFFRECHGLKAKIRITRIEEVPLRDTASEEKPLRTEESEERPLRDTASEPEMQGIRLLTGQGTIEGYTSEQEREIAVEMQGHRVLRMRTFLLSSGDWEAFASFPLWSRYYAYVCGRRRCWDQAIDLLIRKYACEWEGQNI